MQPIVFLGPSLPVNSARQILPHAHYEPPVRRGDLEAIPSGATVALIDGVFEQELAVSPREVYEAVRRGVRVFGGASMGALRASEVPGVVGVGRIYQWYSTGVLTRDDEVSLLFDHEERRAITVPMVNVRFAVERLCRPGTLDREDADKIIEAALELPYERRHYKAILRRAGLWNRVDALDLLSMLQAHDLKREDAQAVLETLERHLRTTSRAEGDARVDAIGVDALSPAPSHETPATGDAVFVWESGDTVQFDALVAFLGLTGKLEHHVRQCAARFLLEGNELEVGSAIESSSQGAQALFDAAAQRWGWLTGEEARVTLADLGLEVDDLSERCGEEQVARDVVRELVGRPTPEFRRALRAQLFLDDLALKREALRLASLHQLAAADEEGLPPTASELADAYAVSCRANAVRSVAQLRERWAALGLSGADVDMFLQRLVSARRVARGVVERMRRPGEGVPRFGPESFRLTSCPKPSGEPRFALPLRRAHEHAQRLRDIIGVTRVGLIGELSELGGVQVAQASRPHSTWSSTYGGGKSLSSEGAIVGSIMEEVEKWAQDRFAWRDKVLLRGSFESLRATHPVVDPATLDLPFDTSYDPQETYEWYEAHDLIQGGPCYVPIDVLQQKRSIRDIHYSTRGGRKVTATNGLASGFSREEALLHAICEFVERHAARMAELFIANPGGLGRIPFEFVDLRTASPRLRELETRLSRSGSSVRVLNITSEVRIPTFTASIIRDFRRADGQAAHPNPEVAIEMALLEAAQTIAGNAAGGREDLSIRTRSLGRHERPRPVSLSDFWHWQDPDPVLVDVGKVGGVRHDDVLDDVHWCVERVAAAGLDHLCVADFTVPEIEPAHVVRVTIPGLETVNPFHTGLRARLALLRDLVPKWA